MGCPSQKGGSLMPPRRAKPKKDEAGKEAAPFVAPEGNTVEQNVIARMQANKNTAMHAVKTGNEVIDSDVSEYISTQCPALNVAIGRPGIPVGRLTTLIGLEASGKSTLALHILIETQKIGGIAVLFDAEKRYDKERGARMGIDNSRLITPNGETLEDMLEQMHALIDAVREETPDRVLTIVLDSVAGSAVRADLDPENNSKITHAPVLSAALRPLHAKISKQRVALVFVNQLRHNIVFGPSYGKPDLIMVGEKSLTYWSSLKIMTTQAGRLGDDKQNPYGIMVRAECLKNTVAPPFRQAIFNVNFQTGVDWMNSALDVAVSVGLVVQTSAWYKYGDEGKSFQRKDWPELLAEKPELMEMIKAAPLLWQAG